MTTESLTESLRETLRLFEGSNAGSPRTTIEVAEELDLGRRSTYERLERLVANGCLETKKVGARGRVWWLPPPHGSGGDQATPPDEPETRVDHTEQQLRSLVRAAEEYAVFVLDPDGHVQTWNRGAERITGHRAEDVVGEHVATFYTDEDRAAGVPGETLEAAAEDGSLEGEGWRVRDDGTRFPANATITATRGDAGDLEGFVMVTRDTTDRRGDDERLAGGAQRREQERDDREQDRDDAFGRVDDAFYALDEAFRFEFVNERAETFFDATESELLGRPVWDALEVDDDGIVERFETAMATQESTSFEHYSDTVGTWNVVHAYPGESGLSVSVTDVTPSERVPRDSGERFRPLMEHSPFSIQLFDAEGRPFATNPAWERLWDASREDLADYNVLQDEQLAAAGLLTHIRDAFDGEVVTLPVVHYDPAEIGKPGRARWIEGYAYPLTQRDGETVEVALVHHDITERKERARELEQYETIVETVTDGVYVLDEAFQFTLVNDAYCEMTGYDREELIGASASLVVDEEVAAESADRLQEITEGDVTSATLEAEIVRSDGSRLPAESNFTAIPSDDGEHHWKVGVVRDLTEHKERERALERSERRYRALAEHFPNGAVALFDDDLRYTLVAGSVFDDGELSAADVEGRRVGETASGNTGPLEEYCRAALAGREATFEFEDEERIRQTWTIPVRDHDESVFAGMVMTQDITDRVERERELERQREQLTALDAINGVVRRITDAVIEQSTHEEIDRAVVEALADADPYEFAWVGDFDAATEAVELRATAGVEGPPDGSAISVGRADDRGGGPTERALRTGEMQVTQDVGSEARDDGWREHVEALGVRSAAAIPIVHEGTVYGVLNVYATRPDAFTGQEGEVLGQVGEIAGHAIAAVERKRALTSDEVVELEFVVPGIFEALDLDVSGDGAITLDQSVPTGDGSYLVYGTATGEALSTVERLVDADELPHWSSIAVLRTDEDRTRFEVELVDPPVLSLVGAHGGYVHEATIEGGDFAIRIQLAPTTDVRHVVEVIQEAYPGLEMVTRRQTMRDDTSLERLNRTLADELSDRQRTTIETAYHRGYFEWPRESTGEEAAASIGISPATFSQHLRKAQRTLLETIFEDRG